MKWSTSVNVACTTKMSACFYGQILNVVSLKFSLNCSFIKGHVLQTCHVCVRTGAE